MVYNLTFQFGHMHLRRMQKYHLSTGIIIRHIFYHNLLNTTVLMNQVLETYSWEFLVILVMWSQSSFLLTLCNLNGSRSVVS